MESGQWSEKSHGSVIRDKGIRRTEWLKTIIRHKDCPLFESRTNPHHIVISNTGNKMKNRNFQSKKEISEKVLGIAMIGSFNSIITIKKKTTQMLQIKKGNSVQFHPGKLQQARQISAKATCLKTLPLGVPDMTKKLSSFAALQGNLSSGPQYQH